MMLSPPVRVVICIYQIWCTSTYLKRYNWTIKIIFTWTYQPYKIYLVVGYMFLINRYSLRQLFTNYFIMGQYIQYYIVIRSFHHFGCIGVGVGIWNSCRVFVEINPI